MKTLNAALIGPGFIGKQHVESIRRIPATQVLAVAGSSPQKSQTAAQSLAIPKSYDNYHQLLSDPEIDIIHNCTPGNLHYTVSKDALNAGKHVWCEKPLTFTSAEADELAALAQQKGLAHGVCFNYRHNAMVKEMRERTRTSTGRVFTAYAEYLQDWLMFDTDYTWRMDPAKGGASRAIGDIGSHSFDTLQYILNKRITAVYAKLFTVFPERKLCESTGETFSGNTGKVLEIIPIVNEDAAHIMVRFEDGTPGLIQVSQITGGYKNGLAVNIAAAEYSMQWQQEQADRLHLGHRNRGNEELYAEAAVLTPFARPYATLPGGHAVAWQDAFTNGIASFYQAIRDGSYKTQKPDYADFHDGAHIMRVIEACLESNTKDKWIEIAL